MSKWREGLEGDGAWLQLVGDVTIAEFFRTAGTQDVRAACRAQALRLPQMYPEEIPTVTDADVEWVTDTLSAYIAEQGGR